MQLVKHTAEAFAYRIMVSSGLDNGRMVIGLATTSKYTVMVSSLWGRGTLKMELNGEEAESISKMARRRSMTIDYHLN